jgi:hypothetical protein
MLQPNSPPPSHGQFRGRPQPGRAAAPDRTGDQKLEARVKSEWVHLYPGVDPSTWYKVIEKGEYRDEMEGLWIQVSDWVTYVLARHFDLQAAPGIH